MKNRILSILSAGVIIGFGGLAEATPVITDGLVAAYEFNGNANDSSGNGNDGIVYGASSTTDRFGNTNSAYSFDGNDYIITPNFSAQDNGTLSFWFAANTWHANGGAIISSRSGYEDGDLIIGEQERDSPIQAVYWADGSWHFASYSISISSSTWNHAVLVWDSVLGTKFYVNNALVNSDPYTAPIFHNIPIDIGRQGYNGDYRYFDGLIDDIFIYDHALSSTDIDSLYTGVAPVPEPATMLLLGTGLAGLAGSRLRRKRKE